MLGSCLILQWLFILLFSVCDGKIGWTLNFTEWVKKGIRQFMENRSTSTFRKKISFFQEIQVVSKPQITETWVKMS